MKARGWRDEAREGEVSDDSGVSRFGQSGKCDAVPQGREGRRRRSRFGWGR